MLNCCQIFFLKIGIHQLDPQQPIPCESNCCYCSIPPPAIIRLHLKQVLLFLGKLFKPFYQCVFIPFVSFFLICLICMLLFAVLKQFMGHSTIHLCLHVVGQKEELLDIVLAKTAPLPISVCLGTVLTS
jgi:hypothetical protein